jgi:hypothetical protein
MAKPRVVPAPLLDGWGLINFRRHEPSERHHDCDTRCIRDQFHTNAAGTID